MADHLKAIDRAVMKTITGKGEPILIVETPPRHGKSTFISKWLACWYLCRYPDRHVILTSASNRMAEKWGRRCRNTLQEIGPSLFGVDVGRDKWAADNWLTNRGGGMISAGVGGDVMGEDGHLLIIDDYLKNSEQAVSETIRDKQWDWWQSTFSTRMEPGGCAVIMATRWHSDDLIGRLVLASETGEGLPVRRIRLPAIAEENDYLGRLPGQPLWPQRWPLGEKNKKTINDEGRTVIGMEMRRNITELYWWNALYQQRPSRHGRAEWPDAYFKDLWTDYWPDRFESSAIAVDPSKGTGSKTGDYFAVVFVGLAGGLLWVDAHLVRSGSISTIVGGSIDFTVLHHPDAFGIEANAFQDLLAPEFDRQTTERFLPPLPISLIHNHENKIQIRIPRIGPYLARNKLRFRACAGCRLLVRQLQEFPLADHDDGPDALEMAIRLLHHHTDHYQEPDEEGVYT